MARVTVDDCLKFVKNRFELVHLAAKRTRQLMHGKDAKVDWDNDKPTVVALREIAAGYTEFADHFADQNEHDIVDAISATFISPPIKEDEDDELDEPTTHAEAEIAEKSRHAAKEADEESD